MTKFIPIRLLINFFSYFVVLLSFYFIYNVLKDYDLSVSFIHGPIATVFYLFIFGLINSFFIFYNGYIFKLILDFNNNSRLSLISILGVYVKSNITKYIPSNIVPYIFRIYLGNKVGLSKMNIAVSGFLEIFFGISNTAIIILLLLLSNMSHFPKEINFQLNFSNIFLLLQILTIGLSLLLAIYLIYLYKKKRLSRASICEDFNRLLTKYFNFRFLFLYLKIFFIYFFSFVLSTILFYMMSFVILDLQLKPSDFFNIAICLGIAGYSAILTPGVPGGIGVKESVSVLLVSLYGYEKAPIILAVILLRIVHLLSDIIGYFIILFFEKSKK